MKEFLNKCLYCGKNVRNKYCNVSCQNKNKKGKFKVERFIFIKFCEKCNTQFEVIRLRNINNITKKEKRFCCRKCANSHILSDESKKKISIGINNYNLKNGKIKKQKIIKVKKIYVDKFCEICSNIFKIDDKSNKRFCSQKCVNTYRGRISASKNVKRSKNEIYFSELCENIFNNILTNKQIFNGWDADIILNNEKIAILWNGKWHYEKLNKKHSVKQVQNRDRIKIENIIKCGYYPYIIKDMGKYNRNFVEYNFDKLLEFIKQKDQVIQKVS